MLKINETRSKGISFAAKLAVFAALALLAHAAGASAQDVQEHSPLLYPIPLQSYPTEASLWETLCRRVRMEPLNLYVSIIFLCAVIHTFCYRVFLRWSASVKERKQRLTGITGISEDHISTISKVLKLFGEVEIIFALWLIPLFALICWFYGYHTLAGYMNKLAYEQDKYAEPVFVIVIMCMASARPVILFATNLISRLARFGGETVGAWWVSILVAGPLLGSFITEPAAIMICAILLSEKFYKYGPSRALKYATLGLLFVSISVGGTLSHFSAPPVLMVAKTWDWGLAFMFKTFGIKAIVGIVCATALYFAVFGKEFKLLQQRRQSAIDSEASDGQKMPAWITCTNIAFIVGSVLLLHYPVLLVFLFLAFIGFVDVTSHFQPHLKYRSPILVGIFLAALVTHGSLQGWWIEPVLMSMEDKILFAGTIFLTAFNDNAAITYLASLVPNFSDAMKYIVLSGAVSGGGLTVIANAPNLAGLSVLKEHFKGGVSPILLFAGAAVPTAIMSVLFYFWSV